MTTLEVVMLVDTPAMVASRAMLEVKLITPVAVATSVELLPLVVIPGVVVRLSLLAAAGKLLLLFDATFCQSSSSWRKT
jgi:hypothetical protein